MKTKNLMFLITACAVLAVVLPTTAQENPEDWSGVQVWPREYSNEAGAKLVMYQPQVTAWESAKRLEARIAISFSAPGAEVPSLGAFEIEGDTEVDLDTRLVNLSAVEIVKHRDTGTEEAGRIVGVVTRAIILPRVRINQRPFRDPDWPVIGAMNPLQESAECHNVVGWSVVVNGNKIDTQARCRDGVHEPGQPAPGGQRRPLRGRRRAESLPRGYQARPMRHGVLNGHFRLARSVRLVEPKKGRRF